jgi:hypothetical protein
MKSDMEPDAEKVNEGALGHDSPTSQVDTEKQVESNSAINDGAVPQIANPMHPSQFPDGGTQAWLTVFGGFIGLVVSFGWINCEYLSPG